jgi:Alpha amylase, catalytic domain
MPHFKTVLIGFVLLFHIILYFPVQSQNAVVGIGFSNGWGGNCPNTGNANFNYMSNSFGNSFGGTFSPNNIGIQYFRFGIDWDFGATTAQRTISIGSDVVITPNTEYSLNNSCTTSGAMGINVQSINNRYVFKTKNAGSNPIGDFIFFEIQGAVQSLSLISQSPASLGVTSSTPVVITANTNSYLNTGQGVYLRYTTNNWSSSTVIPMTGSLTSYSASIPAFPISTNVKYYVFTSGHGLVIDPEDADWYTINGNTNNGNNYSYTVIAGAPTVYVSPPLPEDNVSVLLEFNATGTDLEGVSKVYLHSGVSTSPSLPTSFSYTIGNWGLDDGVGQMINMGGNNWAITIPSLRSFYNVPVDKDIFGLNFLFRNASGNVTEDNNGANYFNATNPGNYFGITFPTSTTHFALVGQAFNVTATANTASDSWTLKEIHPDTDSDISTLTTINGGINFSFPLTMSTAILRKFKLEVNFGATIKSKTFTVIGFAPVSEASRPSWTKPGINYHLNDPTKATLVLHAPTYTRYKKGNGYVSGTSTTNPKSTVYVIGDFNNWTPSEAYKMIRDRDGWNGTTDADNDDDRGDYWWMELSGLNPGQEYVFQYLIDGILQVADPYTSKVSDPDDIHISNTVYPDLISYRPQSVDRASVLQTNQSAYLWTAPAFTKPTDNQLNIYELHFRDFTEEGTYLAAIDKLDYIKGLGVNAIHVMPVSEFEGNSSWGYNPNFYFAADKAYGKADDLKKFIDECHKRKIQVFNDLVLNHAFYSNVMAKMYWNSGANRPADDNPWFNPLHKMVADAGGWWGADWNHESEHTQIMVDTILDYWLQEFKFDGFRFDFTKGFGQTAPDANDPWASSFDQDRINLLKRMVYGMKTRNPGSVVIFEHLAWALEDKKLSDTLGILMWSGVGHHNDLKGFILGYNGDNTNIYTSGVYNAFGRNFEHANWMSYGESHDEERLGYEVKSYFNWASYTGPKETTADSLAALVNRLKMAVAFNLLFPGPRMLWQFQEVGYDVSINFNGRTGEKPVRWEYYDNSKRRELYSLVSLLFKLRNDYYWYSDFPNNPDFGNIGLGASNIATPRRMSLKTPGGKQIIVVANLDPSVSRDVTPGYISAGTWYRHHGGIMFDTTFEIGIGQLNSTYNLAPSELLILTNFNPYKCTEVRNTGNSGEYSLRSAINCALENGNVQIEFPVYDQTITLSSPINIDKNITITGFPSKNVIVSGLGFSGSIFSIAEGKTVTMNGFKINCTQGGSDGRCILNNGVLTLDEMELKDINGAAGGSSVYNTGTGMITIENNVRIHK